MIIIDATTDSITLLTSSSVSTDYEVSWDDITTSAFTPGNSDGNIASATTTTIVASPAASTQRQVKYVYIRNNSSTTNQTVTVKYTISGTDRYISPAVTLAAGQSYVYTDQKGWRVMTASGKWKLPAVSQLESPATNFVMDVRAGSSGYGFDGTDTIFTLQNFTAATPYNAFAVGSSGLGGRAITGGTSETGTIQIPNSGGTGHLINSLEMCSWNASTATTQAILLDMLWVNNGLVVTTTTAQTINSVTLPARDIAGSTNGDGLVIGLLCTSATTNAANITNTTISYTNQAGTASRTATLLGDPANVKAGTFALFNLQAGDRGVRSIQTCTLGTSFVTGALSLFIARLDLATFPMAGQPQLSNSMHQEINYPTNTAGSFILNSAALMWAVISFSSAATILGTCQLRYREK